jgi:hypothetical protein
LLYLITIPGRSCVDEIIRPLCMWFDLTEALV